MPDNTSTEERDVLPLVSEPSNSALPAILGGSAGGLLFLLAVACCVYYKFVRKLEPKLSPHETQIHTLNPEKVESQDSPVHCGGDKSKGVNVTR